MKEREMQSYIEEREREVAEREAAWKAELSRREAEIGRQEARLKTEKENLEKEKRVLMGTASNQDSQDGALEITSLPPQPCRHPRWNQTIYQDFVVGLSGDRKNSEQVVGEWPWELLTVTMADSKSRHTNFLKTQERIMGTERWPTAVAGSDERGRILSQHKAKSSSLFSVRSFGAKANGHVDDSEAFKAAWKRACKSSGSVTVLVPKGTYLIGPVKFSGPCRNVSSLTVKIKGHLKATTDLSRYGQSAGWIEFGRINRLNLIGDGIFDGQGAKAWPFNNCSTDFNCKLLPTNLKFISTNNTVVRGITSLNSKLFHIALVGCRNFKGSKIKISAPAHSPNTDGIHIERSSSVYFSQSHIHTGDDCISIGQGNSQVTITGITCGPGHGISVGSLGKYENEGDVSGLIVKDCVMRGTTNGIRIKTWPDSPGSSAATNMTFQNIFMKNVKNPIIIDQSYCPFSSCRFQGPSKVKLSDIYFKKIRGTSSSRVAVALECSRECPCENVFLEDVDLVASSGNTLSSSTCKFVKAKYSGIQIPPPCL